MKIESFDIFLKINHPQIPPIPSEPVKLNK